MNELDLTPFKVEFDHKIEWHDTEPGDLLVLRQEQLYRFNRRDLTGQPLKSMCYQFDIDWADFIRKDCWIIEAVYRIDFDYPEKCEVED